MQRKGRASWNVDAIGAAFAEAAVNPLRWNAAMDTIARETGSFGAVMFSGTQATPNPPMSHSVQAAMDVYFREGWHLRDERTRTIPMMIKYGIADDFDWITPDAMKRHRYFQEFLVPLGLQYFGLVKTAADGDLCTAIQRSPEQGPFSIGEKRRLALLSPSLSSAAAVARALGFARVEAALAAFEVSGSAVVLLDRFAEVLRVNATAERVLRGDPRIERRRIVSSNHDATAALDRALHVLLWNRSGSALMPPVSLPRTDQRPVLAYPIKLAAVSSDALAACQAILVLVDLEKRVRPPEAVLQAAFGFTPAEARLASRLAAGEEIEAAADTLAIATQTARNQLKSIFDKTGAHRQPELVALLVPLLGQVVGG